MQISDFYELCLRKGVAFFSFRSEGKKLHTGVCVEHSGVKRNGGINEIPDDCYVVAKFDIKNGFYSIKDDYNFDGEEVPLYICQMIENMDDCKCEKSGHPYNMGREEYEELLENSIKEIENCLYDKIVYSRAKTVELSERNPIKTVVEDSCRCFFNIFSLGNGICWLGRTPELLLAHRNGSYKTMALAGTRKISEHKEVWDEKNIIEQGYVSDYIENILLEFEAKNIRKSAGTLDYKNIQHVVTDFSFEIETCNHDKLIKRLHPTPAVCGWPKENAFERIIANEGYDRGFYAGLTGYYKNETDFSLYVNLRCMMIGGGKVTAFAGGGITAKSEPKKEWEETEIKIKTILN